MRQRGGDGHMEIMIQGPDLELVISQSSISHARPHARTNARTHKRTRTHTGQQRRNEHRGQLSQPDTENSDSPSGTAIDWVLSQAPTTTTTTPTTTTTLTTTTTATTTSSTTLTTAATTATTTTTSVHGAATMDRRWPVPTATATFRAAKGAAVTNKADIPPCCKALWLRECTHPVVLPFVWRALTFCLPSSDTFSLTSLAIPGQCKPYHSHTAPSAHSLFAPNPVMQILCCKPCTFVPRSASSFATPPIAPISTHHHPYSTPERPRPQHPPPTCHLPSLQIIPSPRLLPTGAAPAQHMLLQTQGQTPTLPQTSTERTPIQRPRSPRTRPPYSPHFAISSCISPIVLSTTALSPPPRSSQSSAEKTNSSAIPSTRMPTNSSIIC